LPAPPSELSDDEEEKEEEAEEENSDEEEDSNSEIEKPGESGEDLGKELEMNL